MLYFKVPISVEFSQLNHTQLSIYIHLLHLHFKFCGSGRQSDFFMTDRALAEMFHSSTKTIWKTKNLLKELHLIDFFIGTLK